MRDDQAKLSRCGIRACQRQAFLYAAAQVERAQHAFLIQKIVFKKDEAFVHLVRTSPLRFSLSAYPTPEAIAHHIRDCSGLHVYEPARPGQPNTDDRALTSSHHAWMRVLSCLANRCLVSHDDEQTPVCVVDAVYHDGLAATITGHNAEGVVATSIVPLIAEPGVDESLADLAGESELDPALVEGGSRETSPTRVLMHS